MHMNAGTSSPNVLMRGLTPEREELGLLRKRNLRKVICASLVMGRTLVFKFRLVRRLCLSYPAGMSDLVNLVSRDLRIPKILKKYEKILKSKD